MPRTRVRPMVDFYWPDSAPDMATLLGEPPRDDGADSGRRRPRRDFLVRQAFLRSYQFSVQETFPQKLKRMFASVVEDCRLKEKMVGSSKRLAEKAAVVAWEVRGGINGMGKLLLHQIRKEVKLGRLRLGDFRLRMPPVSTCVNPIRCFSARRRSSILHGD